MVQPAVCTTGWLLRAALRVALSRAALFRVYGASAPSPGMTKDGGWTEGVGGDPVLAQDAGVLGRPLEDRRLFGEAEIAPGDVVFGHAVSMEVCWLVSRYARSRKHRQHGVSAGHFGTKATAHLSFSLLAG